MSSKKQLTKKKSIPEKKTVKKAAPAKKVQSVKKGSPKKAAPVKKGASVKKSAPAKTVPVKKAAPVKKSTAKAAPKKAPVAKKTAAVKKAVTVKKAAPTKKVAPQTKKTAKTAVEKKKSVTQGSSTLKKNSVKESSTNPQRSAKSANPKSSIKNTTKKALTKDKSVKPAVTPVTKPAKPGKPAKPTKPAPVVKPEPEVVEDDAILLRGGVKITKVAFFFEEAEQDSATKKKVSGAEAVEKPTASMRHRASLAEETPEELYARVIAELQEENLRFAKECSRQLCTKCCRNPVAPEFRVDKDLGYCEECAEILGLGSSKEARHLNYQAKLLGTDSLDEVRDDDDFEGAPTQQEIEEVDEDLNLDDDSGIR